MSRRRWSGAVLAVVAGSALAACTTGTDPAPVPSGPSPEATIPVMEQVFRERPDPVSPVAAGEAVSGVGQVLVTGQCTGTLVDTGVPTGPAYVLTNGHCADGWGQDGNVVLVDEDAWDGASVAFGLVAGEDPGPVLPVETIAYSTMKGTDVAVLRLEGTLGQAEALGLEPLAIASAAPAPGDEVTNVGIPVQDLPHDAWVQRVGTCTLGEQTDLIEHIWYWHDFWANDCPGIIQGSSGSPLVADGEVVAVINTTTYGGFVRGGECFLGNPCELTEDGEAVVDDRSYAAPVDGLDACFDAEGTFGLGGACPLPGPGLTTSTIGLHVTLDAVRDGTAHTDVTLLSDEAADVSYGLVPATAGQPCLDASAYTGRTRAEATTTTGEGLVEATSVVVDLPATEGRYLWCATTGRPADAAVVVLDVDGTPPVFTPTITVEDIGGTVWIRPTFVAPELANIEVAWGRDLDCATAELRTFLTVPTAIETTDLPVTYCVQGADLAGNTGQVQSFTVTG